jgi:hypothetical protein
MRWTDTGDTNEKNESKVNHMRWTESTVGAKSIILHVELHGKEKNRSVRALIRAQKLQKIYGANDSQHPPI